MRDDGKIQPFPSLSIEKKLIKGCWMIVIKAEPSNSPPVRLNGVTWIRGYSNARGREAPCGEEALPGPPIRSAVSPICCHRGPESGIV